MTKETIIKEGSSVRFGDYSDIPFDFNLDDFEPRRNGKALKKKKRAAAFNKIFRAAIINEEFIFEGELLAVEDNYRFSLHHFDKREERLCERSWILPRRTVKWNNNPEDYTLEGHFHGVHISVRKVSLTGNCDISLRFFDLYNLSMRLQIPPGYSSSLKTLNPYFIDGWRFTEKHGYLKPYTLSFTTESGLLVSTPDDIGVVYEWCGGYLPPKTESLRVCLQSHKNGGIGAALSVMGFDSCASENALWIDGKQCVVDRIIPASSTPDAESSPLLSFDRWSFTSSDSRVAIHFEPYANQRSRMLNFPLTKNHRIYGTFDGEVKRIGKLPLKIDKASGFIDCRQINWR